MANIEASTEDSGYLWDRSEYGLLDFGSGRKLEQFGQWLLDRPCPAAVGQRMASKNLWANADAVLSLGGQLERGEVDSENWQVAFRSLKFNLALTPFGHVGLFPEQAANWHWLEKHLQPLSAAVGKTSSGESPASLGTSSGLKVLNLFAYTGGTTLMCASWGYSVVHVDASAPSVAWARRNALVSGLRNAPVRWIIDDVRKFVAREVRRGNRYECIVLDPPTYGHGAAGQRWEIDRDLPPLMQMCAQLLAKRSIVILSCHSEEFACSDLTRLLKNNLIDADRMTLESSRMTILDLNRRPLDMGAVVRANVGC